MGAASRNSTFHEKKIAKSFSRNGNWLRARWTSIWRASSQQQQIYLSNVNGNDVRRERKTTTSSLFFAKDEACVYFNDYFNQQISDLIVQEFNSQELSGLFSWAQFVVVVSSPRVASSLLFNLLIVSFIPIQDFFSNCWALARSISRILCVLCCHRQSIHSIPNWMAAQDELWIEEKKLAHKMEKNQIELEFLQGTKIVLLLCAPRCQLCSIWQKHREPTIDQGLRRFDQITHSRTQWECRKKISILSGPQQVYLYEICVTFNNIINVITCLSARIFLSFARTEKKISLTTTLPNNRQFTHRSDLTRFRGEWRVSRAILQCSHPACFELTTHSAN